MVRSKKEYFSREAALGLLLGKENIIARSEVLDLMFHVNGLYPDVVVADDALKDALLVAATHVLKSYPAFEKIDMHPFIFHSDAITDKNKWQKTQDIVHIWHTTCDAVGIPQAISLAPISHRDDTFMAMYCVQEAVSSSSKGQDICVGPLEKCREEYVTFLKPNIGKALTECNVH